MLAPTEEDIMTVTELVGLADELVPNVFSDRVKLFELNRLEKRVRVDILEEGADCVVPIEEIDDTELTLDSTYQDVYLCWMKSMYYWHMGEYELYENEKAMFEEAWERFVRDVCYARHQGTGGSEYQ